jgi:large subunit ribosomal protein L29
MELDKIRNLGDAELAVEEHKAGEQLFRLRFQLKLGQTDGVKKLRLLKKDIARIKTIQRERELSLHGAEHKEESSTPKKAARTAAKGTAKKAPKTVAKKTAAKNAIKKTTKKEAR